MTIRQGRDRINEARAVLEALGLPRQQLNERSALCLLALLDLDPTAAWADSRDPLMGVTPIMDWARKHYGKRYAPNTRETIRRQTLHQFCGAGIACYNPDAPERAVNSPRAVYQIEPLALTLLRKWGTAAWGRELKKYLKGRVTLKEKYAKARKRTLLPVRITEGSAIHLSPGTHSKLIKAIIEEFAPRFMPGSRLIYAGDTGKKWGFFDQAGLAGLGIVVDAHGKMPDIVLYDQRRNWLVLVESVTSHGPMDPKRHGELADLFASPGVGLVFVTAFPNRLTMKRYLSQIAWETEVWVADSPAHLIHFNGDRFLGPHDPVG